MPVLIRGLISVGNSLLEDPSSSSFEHSQIPMMEFDHYTASDNLFSSMDRHTSSSPTGGGQTQLLIDTEYGNHLSSNCPSTSKQGETEEPHVHNEITTEKPKYQAVGHTRAQIPSTDSISIRKKQKHAAKDNNCVRRSTRDRSLKRRKRPSASAMIKRKRFHHWTEYTPWWRKGPRWLQTLCNAWGIHYRAAGQVTFSGESELWHPKHSNSYKKIQERRPVCRHETMHIWSIHSLRIM